MQRKLKGRLVDLAISLTGKQRITVEVDNDARAAFEELKEKDVSITLSEWREKRSLTANAYCWVLIDKIAAKTKVGKTEVYRNAIRDIGGVSELVCMQTRAVESMKKTWSTFGIGWQAEELDSNIPGWTNLILYKGSSVYDRAQMAALIDSLVQEAKTLGIETRPQEEVDAMLKEVENA